MSAFRSAASPAALLVLLLTGCASDGSSPFGGATGSTTTAAAPLAANPACASLTARIDALRKDGVTERAAQAAATGKTSTVSVKRASLANLAELDKANAEFQAKCSTLGPRPVQAAAPAASAPTTAAASSAPPKAATKVAKAAAAPTNVAAPAAEN